MEKAFEKLIRILVSRPLLVNLLLIFIVVLGIGSMMNMQRLGLPRVDLYQMHIITTYPGASPEDVELNVTKKVEEALEGVSDLEEFRSVSMENISVVSVVIDDTAEDKDDVKDKIEKAVSKINDFPEEVTDRPEIEEEKSDAWPIMSIGFSSTDPKYTGYVDMAKELKDDLLDIPSVAQVAINGAHEKEIMIRLKKDQLDKYRISIEEVISSIRLNKIRLSAGSLESFTTETGIVTLSEFKTIEEIKNIIIRINDAGTSIRLGQIASVSKELKESNLIRKINGNPGISLTITKQGNADILDCVEDINRIIRKFKEAKDIPDYVSIAVLHDESVETEQRLYILYTNTSIGLLLVLVLLFFFFSKRIAFWTALGIPVAFATAFFVASMADISINRISLLGLVVVLGMLVDDSIVVAENIHRHRLKGLSGKDAAASGTAQVLIPVIGTIITTVIAFLPIYFIPGMAMDFAREIPTFVIAMLLGSLVESIFVLPVHLAHEKKNSKKKDRDPLGMGLLMAAESFYGSFLKKMLKHRYLSFTAIIGVFCAAMLVSVMLVRFVMFPVDQATALLVYGETRPDSSLENTERIAKPLEGIVSSLPDEVLKSFRTIIGRRGLYSAETLPNCFVIDITLTPSTEREMTATDVKDYIFENIKKRGVKGIDFIDYYIDSGGPPAGKSVSIDVVGNENEKRRALLKKIASDLEEIGLTEVDTDYREGKPEIRLTPDYELISRGSLSVSQIASVIRTAFDGTIVTYMETADEQIPFRVMLDKRDISTSQPLQGLYTINSRGIVIPVEYLMKKEVSATPQTIYRYNGKRKNTITANLPETMTAAEVYGKLTDKYKDFERENPGFRLNLGGEAEESSKTINRMIFAIALAIIGIYFVLVLQFNSLIQPAIVISAIPFGLIGILLAFGLQGMDLSMLALVGIMGYGGVVVNNSLILVEFINNERRVSKDGSGFLEIVVQGSKTRLVPIFLTTITTVAGLMPTAYGWFGGMDSFISPMIMAMTWGLIIGAPSVLFVIPVLYAIIEDMRIFFNRIFRISGREETEENRVLSGKQGKTAGAIQPKKK